MTAVCAQGCEGGPCSNPTLHGAGLILVTLAAVAWKVAGRG